MFNIQVSSSVVQNYYNSVKDGILSAVRKVRSVSELNPEFVKLLDWIDEERNGCYPNLEKLITAKPDELLNIYEIWREKFHLSIEGIPLFQNDGILPIPIRTRRDTPRIKDVRDYLISIFDYSEFVRRKTIVYNLTKEINIRVCPYCNRQFTFTVIHDRTNMGITRPELDHYFPKSKFPMFALSFYNLIPCCHICNSVIKLDKTLDLGKHYHPYIDEDKSFFFKYYYQRANKTGIMIDYNHLSKAKETCEFFELPQIYKQHSDESDRIDKLYQMFPPNYIDVIYRFLNSRKLYITKNQLLEIIYAHYIVDEPDQEIIGKLRSDLYAQVREAYDKN